MSSDELSMLPEASVGRAAAQFIVRSEGIGGLPPTSNFPVFAAAKNREMGIVGTTMHCLPLLSTISDNYHEFDPIQRKSRAVRLAADSLNAAYDTLNTIARR